MPAALTESSQLACRHNGALQLRAGQSKLTVNGSKVLVAGDLIGADVTGCLTPDSSSSTKCRKVLTAVAGVATKLTVGGRGVLLEPIVGTTNGAPVPAWTVQSAGQTKLEAV